MSSAVSTDQASAQDDGARGEAGLWAAFGRSRSALAREQLFACHQDFAETVARRYFRKRSRGDLDLGDLKQLAYAGLLEAIDRFDPAHGVPFRGYALRRVVGSVLSGLAVMSEQREQVSWQARLRRDRVRSLRQADIRSATDEIPAVEALAELAAGLALGFMLEGTDLFHDPDRSGRTPSGAAYESAAWNELLARLRRELADLPEREGFVIRNHYQADMSFEQIADVMSLSRGRISQLHHQALRRLAKRLGRSGHRGLDREGYQHGS